MTECKKECLCRQPISEGAQTGGPNCEQEVMRWMAVGEACVQKPYTGCGGNGNNFKTQGECQSVCNPREMESLMGFDMPSFNDMPFALPPGSFGSGMAYPGTPIGGKFGGPQSRPPAGRGPPPKRSRKPPKNSRKKPPPKRKGGKGKRPPANRRPPPPRRNNRPPPPGGNRPPPPRGGSHSNGNWRPPNGGWHPPRNGRPPPGNQGQWNPPSNRRRRPPPPRRNGIPPPWARNSVPDGGIHQQSNGPNSNPNAPPPRQPNAPPPRQPNAPPQNPPNFHPPQPNFQSNNPPPRPKAQRPNNVPLQSNAQAKPLDSATQVPPPTSPFPDYPIVTQGWNDPFSWLLY